MSEKPQPLKIGSLFSGYGGLDLGVMQVLDAQPAWHVEVDPAPAAILASHYPDVPNLGDVSRVDWAEVPPVDIITAGYPCQPFSQAGHRRGTNDDRHLWPYVCDAIKHLRPRFCLFENVSGHVTLGLAEVLDDLATLGFDAEWACTRASEIGAPHHRERLFIIATHADGLGLEARRLARRPAAKITWDNDMLDFLAGLNAAADLGWELENRWGDHGPAILQWALVTGREPPPIITDHVGPSLHPRFPEIRAATSAEFIEWTMGLNDGWVTSVPGLSRAQKIKALGNGVVPQQAAAALQELLERIEP